MDRRVCMPGLFLCNRKFLGISCYIKGTDVPKMRIRAKMQTVVSDRVRRENMPRHIFYIRTISQCILDIENSLTLR